MFGPLRGFVIAAALLVPSAGVAQLQVNQNFVGQGPAPSFGPINTVQSADAPNANGNVAGAVGPVVADPLDVNTFYVGTPAGGIWKTTNGGTTWTPLTDKQASLSIAKSLLRSHRPNPQNFDRGDGPHRQWHGLSRLDHASLPVPAACRTEFCTRKMQVTRGLRWARRRSQIRAWLGLAPAAV